MCPVSSLWDSKTRRVSFRSDTSGMHVWRGTRTQTPKSLSRLPPKRPSWPWTSTESSTALSGKHGARCREERLKMNSTYNEQGQEEGLSSCDGGKTEG